MPDADIIRVLRQFNRHWETGQVSDLIRRSPHKRRSFEHLHNRIRELPFEVVAGPRQVGKTTLLGHLMAALIEENVPRERVLYVPADNPALSLAMGGHLAPVIEAYERFILQEQVSRTKDAVFLFIDEVHTLPDWGSELKGLYDLYHPALRVLATGSSSAALINPPTADLPGRVERSHIHPLKFGEVVQNALPTTGPLHAQARATRRLFATSTRASRHALASSLEALYRAASEHEGEIKALFDIYVLRGGYPAAQPPSTEEDAMRFFENTTDTVLSKDLKLYEKVRKPGAFRAFLSKLAKEQGGKFVAASYAKDLGVDKETPATWKSIAEELFIVHQLPQLNGSLKIVPAKADKAYIQDAGLRTYLSASPRLEDLERSGEIGRIVEGVLFDHLRRLQFNTIGHRAGRIGYWERPEVDFLVELPGTWLAVECKYRAAGSTGRKRLGDAFRETNDVIPLLATRDAFDVGADVWSIPVWLLLLTS
ncbi:MAG: ATP-binding protein [Euryarchaeota archaeon]|nr:ATP-binding protein [Euryarchaeota archaeon]